MNLVGCIPRFIKKHLGWILTGFSSLGVIGTAILAAEEGAAAKEILQAATDEKGAELTFWEKTEEVAPVYLPVILVGGGTIACMIGAQVFNQKQIMALVAAYGLLAQQFDAYRDEVFKELGTEREKEIFEASQKKIKELKAENERLRLESEPHLYAITTLPGVIFEARPEHMQKVFYHMLFNLLNFGGISLQDLYSHIGFPEYLYDKEDAEKYGWYSYENEVTWSQCGVEFELVDILNQEGRTVHVISPSIDPYELGLDYGSSDSSVDHLYPECDYDRTELAVRTSYTMDVEHFKEPAIWFNHVW